MAIVLDGTTGISNVDGSAAAPSYKAQDGNTGLSGSADQIVISTGGSERLRVASAGQLGIAGANYGTDGHVLTSTGASSAPAWEAVSTGLSWTTSSVQTADNSEANYLWDSIPATACIIVVHFQDWKSNSDSSAYMRVGTAASWLETGDKYDYSAGYINHDGSTGADQNDNKIRIFRGDSGANTRRQGNIAFYKAGDNYWTWSHMGGHDHNNSHMSFSAGTIEVGAALTRIIVMCNSGNWASGKIWMSYLG